MIRIAISCGEGFSSGFLANRLEQEVKDHHLEDRASFIRIPYINLAARQNEVDIAMIMPHIEWKVRANKTQYRIPLYVIPFKVMIKPTVEDYIEDAEDILKLADGKGGRVRFPEEKRTADVTRLCSHRKWLAERSEKQ